MAYPLKVSLFLGNVESKDKFQQYIDVHYNPDDEDDIRLYGEFIEAFGIERDNHSYPEFDPYDNIEARYLFEVSNKISDFLYGLSFYKTIIGEFEKDLGKELDKYYNMAIVVYAYLYTGEVRSDSGRGVSCGYIGSIETEV